VDHVEKNVSSYQALYQMIKAAETGNVERTAADAESATGDGQG